MHNLRRRVMANEVLFGTFLNLGSSLTAEMAGLAGFDFVVIDLEHGAGSEADLAPQLQALEHTGAAAIVRVESLERPRFHRVLDLGAHGIMVPRIVGPADAVRAVAALRYPPAGVRGLAMMNRACQFGAGFKDYLASANHMLTGVIQIETIPALDMVEEIAAIDGVDVLFVGPLDLSHAMGITGQFDHPDFLSALRKVAAAARSSQKSAGILMTRPEDFQKYFDLGYHFLPCGSDGGMLNVAARNTVTSLQNARKNLLVHT
jgi:4-hydroxy-2-oxoheptanedioate aldolase